MVPVWGSRLRRWRSANTANTSASSAERYFFLHQIRFCYSSFIKYSKSNILQYFSMQWRGRLLGFGGAKTAEKLKLVVHTHWSKASFVQSHTSMFCLPFFIPIMLRVLLSHFLPPFSLMMWRFISLTAPPVQWQLGAQSEGWGSRLRVKFSCLHLIWTFWLLIAAG